MVHERQNPTSSSKCERVSNPFTEKLVTKAITVQCVTSPYFFHVCVWIIRLSTALWLPNMTVKLSVMIVLLSPLSSLFVGSPKSWLICLVDSCAHTYRLSFLLSWTSPVLAYGCFVPSVSVGLCVVVCLANVCSVIRCNSLFILFFAFFSSFIFLIVKCTD